MQNSKKLELEPIFEKMEKLKDQLNQKSPEQLKTFIENMKSSEGKRVRIEELIDDLISTEK